MQLPPINMEPQELLSTQIAVAYLTSNLLKVLKYQKWFPLMAQEAKVLNRIFAGFVAFVAAIGVHWTFDMTTGTMIITGLTMAGIAHAIWAWFEQFALQQGVFKLIVQPEEVRQQNTGELPKTSLTTGTGDGK